MTVEISVQRVLGVVRDFESSGGASLGLVAWELSVEEEHVGAAWGRAVADALLAPLGVDPINLEELWRLTERGWEELGRLDEDPADALARADRAMHEQKRPR
jgi:hypothetical protein